MDYKAYAQQAARFDAQVKADEAARTERLDREEAALAAIDAEVWANDRGQVACKHHRMPGMKPADPIALGIANLADACWHDFDHGRFQMTDAEVRAYARVR